MFNDQSCHVRQSENILHVLSFDFLQKMLSHLLISSSRKCSFTCISHGMDTFFKKPLPTPLEIPITSKLDTFKGFIWNCTIRNNVLPAVRSETAKKSFYYNGSVVHMHKNPL